MIKVTVLDVTFEPVFDMWGMKIEYQNKNILKRGEFKDNELGVYSNSYPEYIKDSNILFIKGNFVNRDNDIIILSNEDKLKIEEKIKKLNEKYCTYKFSRVEEGTNYYYITSEFEVGKSEENYDYINKTRNKKGNYFFTKEKALECLDYLKKCLIDWHKERRED